MKELVLVQHVNKISGWDNDVQREIFCKREQKLVPLDTDKCDKCPYFVTSGQGDVIVCGWNDTPPAVGTTKVIEHSDRLNELYRVSEMIDDGVLKKG